MKTVIDYVEYADHLLDMEGVNLADCEAYEAALVDALAARFPNCETSVELRYGVSGVGSGPAITPGDDESIDEYTLADAADRCAHETLMAIVDA